MELNVDIHHPSVFKFVTAFGCFLYFVTLVLYYILIGAFIKLIKVKDVIPQLKNKIKLLT